MLAASPGAYRVGDPVVAIIGYSPFVSNAVEKREKYWSGPLSVLLRFAIFPLVGATDDHPWGGLRARGTCGQNPMLFRKG